MTDERLHKNPPKTSIAGPSILEIAHAIVKSYAADEDVFTRSGLTDEVFLRAYYLKHCEFDSIQASLSEFASENPEFFIPLHWIRISYFFAQDLPEEYSALITESTMWLLGRDPLCQTLGHPVCDTLMPIDWVRIEARWREILSQTSNNWTRELLMNAAQFFTVKDPDYANFLSSCAKSAKSLLNDLE
jgi:hypothetical protein